MVCHQHSSDFIITSNSLKQVQQTEAGSSTSSDETPKKGCFSCSIMKKTSSLQKKTLLAIGWVQFTNFCALSILGPFFPIEAARKGMTLTVSGFVFSSYALVTCVFSPIFGLLLPHIGTKFMLLSSLLVCGCGTILFGVLDQISDLHTFTTFCFVVRIAAALGSAAYFTASCTMIAQIFPNNWGLAMGTLEIFLGLGLSLGPAIGGFLYAWGGYSAPFTVLGIVMILNIFPNYYWLPGIEEKQAKSGSILKILKNVPVLAISFVILIEGILWNFPQPTLSPHLQQFGLSAQGVSLFFLLLAGVYALSCPLFGWLADRKREAWPVIVAGCCGSFFACLLLGPAPFLTFLPKTVWLNAVALVLLGISLAAILLPTYPGLIGYTIAGGSEDNLGTHGIVSGLWNGMFSMGEMLGPSLGGILVDTYDFPICCTVMAVLSLVVGVMIAGFFTWWGPILTSDGKPLRETDPLLSNKRSISFKYDIESSRDSVSFRA